MRRDKFSLSHYKLATMTLGKLFPITWYETLPGDSFQQSTACLVRCSPLLAPIMHPVIVRIHHWFVPLRLIWEDFEDFITGGSDGDDDSEWPHISSASISEGSLNDYLGVPPASYSPNLEFSALPRRAYTLIFNEFYRDQDLVTAIAMSTASGTDATTPGNILNVSWEKDYFTTARPWEQKGTEVTIPLGDTARVLGIGSVDGNPSSGPLSVRETGETSATSFANYWAGTDMRLEEDASNSNYPGVYADLSDATGISVNDLRLALAIQRYQEARAQYGSRYVEYLRYLGVRSSDARLQRPEYLGGGRQVIQFSEVIQTAEGTDPVGTMVGHGMGAMRTRRFRRFFEEHGIVMSLMSVVPRAIYATGLHRSFFREVKEDYFQRELQNLGEQEVYNKEVYTEDSSPDTVFGYQARYDEYRTMPSTIAGEFRSTMDHWHLARIIASDPALNSTFINCNPSTRIFADEEADTLYVMANHSIQARRPIRRNPTPRTF